ncbi:TPA: restriction endonuclease subunit S [Vibrio parahaemolyticus]|nr:restriction endonuclease subunit S [Vibrio parahaemolyticus]
MSELPKGWVTTILDGISFIITGNTPKKDENNYGGEYAYFKPADLDAGYHIKSSSDTLTHLGMEKARFIPAKSTLVTCIGATIGKTGLTHIDGSCNQQINALVPYKGINKSWLYFAMCSPYMQTQIKTNASSTTLPILNKSKFSALRIDIPPEAEQKRIVEKLDEVLAQVDTIKARLDGIPDLLKRFRQSVLASAVSGKLTEEWRAQNSFDTKAQLKSIRELNPSKPPKEELAKFHGLPSCWEWALVKQVGNVQLGRQRAPKYHQGNNMRPYLRVANVMEGYIDTSDVMEMVFDESDFERYKLVKGDVLLNEGQSHELVGRPSMFNDELENVCFTNTLVRFRAYDGVHNKFAFFVFLNQMKTGRFQQIASRTVNISHLGAGRFADIEFPFPPFEEQKEIVRLVDQYFAFADTIEAQVKKAQARVDNLTQSILAKAFRGELVPQDPNDEPANKLLERIALARKEAEALAKAAKKAETAKKRAANKASV